MTTEITTPVKPQTDSKTGLTLSLEKSLQPQELDKHRANVCVVMEMMVRKYDKFGWDQMTAGMRKMIREDWLHALASFPVDEVRAACRQHTIDMPNKVPNEGHIKAQLMIVRKAKADKFKASNPEPYIRDAPPERSEAAKKRMAKYLKTKGF